MRDALADQQGVIPYEVDWDTAVATVVYDETVIPFETIKNIFEQANFKVKKLN